MAGSPRPVGAVVLAVFFLVLGVTVVVGFALDWLPEVASVHGKGVDRVIDYLLLTSGLIFMFGHLFLAGFILKYSRGVPQQGAVLSHRAEMRWALLPILIMCVIAEGGVFVFALPVFGQVYGDAPEDAYRVEVVGKQFEWLVRYPGPDGLLGRTRAELVHDARNPLGLDKTDTAAIDDIVVRGNVHVPVNRTVVLRLRSLDVLHSFTVPAFRTKQDLIPGFTAHTQFTADREGVFEAACAELCGLGHYRMQGRVFVQSEEDLLQWLREQEPWL